MKQKLAVLDTGILIFLAVPPEEGEDTARTRRRERIELIVQRLQDQGARFVVPTPAIAELHREGPGSRIVEVFRRHLQTRVRAAALDIDGADVAGAMRGVALASAADDEKRGKVTYDALIAGIAHTLQARWLVTTNPKHMRQCLDAVHSPVELVHADGIPAAGQLHIVHAAMEHEKKGRR